MFGSGTPILFVVFIEVVGVFWFYGVSRLSIWQEKIMINMKHDQRSHQIKVLRRRGADAWTEARPVLETLLAIYQVCPHDFLYWSSPFSFLIGKQYAANQKLFWMDNLV